MYCLNCGKQIPDDANFCLYCGKAIDPSANAAEEGFWEYCQVIWAYKRSFWNSEVYFYADAVGKNGKFTAGQSPHYKINTVYESFFPTGYTEDDKKQASDAHSALVKNLIDDGWEPILERGEGWWELRFRRKPRT